MTSGLYSAPHLSDEFPSGPTTRALAFQQLWASLIVSITLLVAATYVAGEALTFEDAAVPHHTMAP